MATTTEAMAITATDEKKKEDVQKGQGEQAEDAEDAKDAEDAEDAEVYRRRPRRKKKSRVISIDGHSVLREDYEERLLLQYKKNTTTATSGDSNSNSGGNVELHDPICLICWDGGDLLLCDKW
jgi:hypothetical protein